MELVVAECCKVHYTSKHHRHEKLDLERDSTPGNGQMAKLLPNQRINRKKCMPKRHDQTHFCASFSDSNVCQSDYAKRKAIVENGRIREIWIENGCYFANIMEKSDELNITVPNKTLKELDDQVKSIKQETDRDVNRNEQTYQFLGMGVAALLFTITCSGVVFCIGRRNLKAQKAFFTHQISDNLVKNSLSQLNK